MKRNLIGILAVIAATVIGVYPASAQQETEKERTVSPAQHDSTSQVEECVKPAAPAGIPPTLTAVQYRRCPMDGQRLKRGKSAVFAGKAYRFCCPGCIEKFWENPEPVVLKLNGNQEVPLMITNIDGKCVCCDKPASREFSRLFRNSITFFCSSACRDKETKKHRTKVSR